MQLQDISNLIKKEVLKYPISRSFPLLEYRLRVLQYGIEKNTNTSAAQIKYTVEDIYRAYLSAKDEIEQCFETINFQNEAHKVNTIFLIISKKISSSAEEIEKMQNGLTNLDNSCIDSIRHEYIKKSGELKDSDRELWNND